MWFSRLGPNNGILTFILKLKTRSLETALYNHNKFDTGHSHSSYHQKWLSSQIWWQNSKERLNRSTNNGDTVDKAKQIFLRFEKNRRFIQCLIFLLQF